MVRKEYKQRERRYVPEYVEQKYPARVAVFYNMAIGPAPEDLSSAYPDIALSHFRRWRYWIDAVVILRDRMVLIEGKLRNPQDGIGQLLLYRSLLPETPELKPYRGLPIEARIVVPREDPRIIAFAHANNIVVDIYRPEWALEYLRELGLE